MKRRFTLTDNEHRKLFYNFDCAQSGRKYLFCNHNQFTCRTQNQNFSKMIAQKMLFNSTVLRQQRKTGFTGTQLNKTDLTIFQCEFIVDYILLSLIAR